MPKKAQVIAIEEMPGNQFPDLQAAQSAALPLISLSFQNVIRDLLDNGKLINVNGKIIPNS